MKKRYLLAAFSLAVVLAACGSSDTGGQSNRGAYEEDKEKEKEEKKEDAEPTKAAEDTEPEEESPTPVPEQDHDEPAEEKQEKDPRLENRPNANTGSGKIKDLEEGDVAPDFTVNTKGGGTFTLSDHDDEVVILNFWATWCPPCVGELPAFERLKEDGKAVVIGVDCGETRREVDSFIDQNGYTYTIGYDEDYVVEDYYPTDGIPYTLVIDHGIIHEIFVGAYDADAMYREYSSSISECIK